MNGSRRADIYHNEKRIAATFFHFQGQSRRYPDETGAADREAEKVKDSSRHAKK